MTLADYEKDPNHITNDFIKYYYSKLSSDCSKLYQLYAPDAVLKHTDHTSDPFKAISTDYHDFDNIKKYWKSLPNLSGAKLVILTVNTIHNSDNSLVTNVVGELLLKEDYENESVISPTRLFTQTFILQPHPSKDNYDIKSDILTFIPDSDYMNVELNGVSVAEDSHSVDALQESAEETPTESREQIQQEVVEAPSTSKLSNGPSGTANGASSDSNSKKITKNTIPMSSSPSPSSSANNTTKQKKSTPTSQPTTITSSSSSSEIPSSSTTATSVNTITRSAETNKSNGVNPTATTSSEPGKKDSSSNSTKMPAYSTPQTAGEAENKQASTQAASTANRNSPTSASSNTPPSTTTTKSDKPSPEASKLHSASPTPPPSSAPSIKQKASSSSSSPAIAPEAKATAISQPAPSVSSTWASALKITNKSASPLLAQSQTVAQQSHSQSSPKSASTQLSGSPASSSAVASSTSNSNSTNQLNRPQLYEIYVNFKNSAVPVDEIDLKSAFSSNKFKQFTIVTINKNNTAIVGFSSQEDQTRALALGKIIQGETQFGIDKREKKTNGKKRSSTFKNANKRN
ncbi:hypothetical protein PMKS-000176 [Pichia membranifaciens]|uniref:NTF2 domain-containing protein n=1 Tax=Pichia membranifaciens TaxID=4926 RepID=A0A1Q2YB40_9ASCO|nr:hypothetical protein PMKS-000176 [Pichia membranifaciens]